MRLAKVPLSDGQQLICVACGRLRPGPIYADLNGRAYVDYYCERHAVEPDPTLAGAERAPEWYGGGGR